MASLARVACTLAALGLVLVACDDERAHGRPDLDIVVEGDDMATVAPTSCVLDGQTRQLSQLDGQHAFPRIASNGTGYVVAWVTYLPTMPATFRIDAVVTDTNGDELGPNLPLSAQGVAAPDPPSLAPVSNGTSIAWTSTDVAGTDLVLTTLDIYGQKLDSSGQPCDPADQTCSVFPITASGLARAPSLDRPSGDKTIGGPTEDQLGVAFLDSRNYPCTTAPCPTGNDVFWKRVQSNGTELIHERQLTTNTGSRYAAPGLAFDGVHEGVVWQQSAGGLAEDLYFSTVDALGQLASPLQSLGSVSGTSAPSTPDLIWANPGYALTSASGSDTSAAVLFQRQTASGAAMLPPKTVSFEGSACAPSIAFDGTNYAIAYQVGCGTLASEIAFIRVTPDGTRLDLDGKSCGATPDPNCGRLLLAVPDSHGSAARPAMVLGNDGSFAVVWMQGLLAPGGMVSTPLDVYLQRVSCN